MFYLKPGCLTIHDIRALLASNQPIQLDSAVIKNLESSYIKVQQIAMGDRRVYGINTGFGKLAETKISKDALISLQKRLILSHAAGVGDALSIKHVQLMMLLKINNLAQGFSGVSPALIHTLVEMYNANIYPIIPSQGSVGASGDLAPLSYLAMGLMGLGEVIFHNKQLHALDALKQAKIKPYELQEKEGLSLINGTQASTACAILGLIETQINFINACITGALSFEALAGKVECFHPRVAELKQSKGQYAYNQLMLSLLQMSEIGEDPSIIRRVQDPYSLRCQPQVMGAVLEQLNDQAKHLIHEANAVSDNPIMLDNPISNGNFHAERTAFCADILAIVGSEIGNIAERRMALLIDHNVSQLPPFLVNDAGLNSGFMISHVTAASLVSENKTYAHPASVDSIPTSGHQEDHVSMAMFASMKNLKVSKNVAHILAIEGLMACQALDFRRPLKTSAPLEAIHSLVRQSIPFYEEDRFLGQDILLMSSLMQSVSFTQNHQAYYDILFQNNV